MPRYGLEAFRCGTPDLFPARRGAIGEFVVRGCSYQAQFRTLTYSFVLGTPDLAGNGEKQAVRDAFATWQRQIPIDFAEVGPTNNANFTIGWFTGDHGDGAPFDGVGNVLAHAFYPPPCGGTHAGKMHFDDAEVWALAAGAGHSMPKPLRFTRLAIFSDSITPPYRARLCFPLMAADAGP